MSSLSLKNKWLSRIGLSSSNERSSEQEKQFREIYRTYLPTVRSVVFRFGLVQELDDVTQTVFLKAWKNFPLFKGQSSIKTWLYRITINQCTDYLRSSSSTNILSVSDHLEAQDQENFTHTDIVRKITTGLDENERTLLSLFYYEELTTGEIAEIIQKPEGTIRSSLSRLRAKLLDHCKDIGVYDVTP